MKNEVKSYSGSDRLQDMSAEVLARRQIFMEKVKKVQRDIKIGKNKPNINYASVVREIGGVDAKNPCAGLIGKIFEPRRKLRPRIKDKISVSIASVNEAIIKVHIVSGINIPVRTESLAAIELLNQQISGKAGNFPNQRGPGQNDYGRNQPQYPPGNYPRDPYDRGDRFDRSMGRPRGPYPDDSLNQGYPPRGAATDYRGGRDFRDTGRDQFGRYDRDMRDGYTTGYNQDRFRNDRFGSSQMYPGGMDRGAPPYSGYGTVTNPYGTMGGRGPLSAFGAGLRGDQTMGQRNLPGVQDMSLMNRTKMELTGMSKLMKGSVFIEVRLSGERTGEDTMQIKRTREQAGSFPDWNETIVFKLFSKNGKAFTEEELIKGNDTLYFSIFDKYETERYIPSTNKHEITVENKFLGSFSIKLVSILQSFPKMEGQIRINRPLNLQGYGMLPSGMLSSNIFNKDIDTELLPSYISLSINLDPLLELPAENEYDFYPGGEDSRLLRAGALWSNSHRTVPKGPPLVVKMFGENVERKSILIWRYLTPQKPPKELLDLERGTEIELNYAIQTIARFVSLIPFIEDNNSFEDMPDMWCTSQEFIDFNGGDYEEHAILLWNYFNYVDSILNKDKVKSYIILGSAVPEGYTTYVLRRNLQNNHVEIWDAVRGFAYFFGNKKEVSRCWFCFPVSVGFSSGKDNSSLENFVVQQNVNCQLKSIGWIIGEENIWANVQKITDPSLCEFDLKNTSHWRPFFNKRNKVYYLPNESESIDTIQTPLFYPKGEGINLAYLEDDIKNYLSQKFADARINHYTRWNHLCNDILRETMRRLEILKRETCCPAVSTFKELKGEGKPTKTSEIFNDLTEDLNDVVRGKKIYGFPINISFTNLDALWEEVKNTGMHNIVGSSVEFALSVFVYKYPWNVISVWIYMMSLTST